MAGCGATRYGDEGRAQRGRSHGEVELIHAHHEVDGEQIIEARLSGGPERNIAKRLGITIADVRDALDRFSATVISHHTRLHRLALDLETIDDMIAVFQPTAKAGDVQAEP
jgi:hypothetical protein